LNTIYLVHHFPIIRNEIRLLITKQYPSTLISCYESFSSLPSTIKKNAILIINLNVPDLNKLKTLKKLQNKGIKIIVWIRSEDETTIRFFLQ
jgi:DNA-binding NarL/FixJ family response regulator